MEKGIIIPEQAADFIKSLNVKQATRIEYARHLNEFLKWAVDNWDVYNPIKADIIRYKQDYLRKTYGVAGLNKRLCVVRLFFKLLSETYGIKNLAEGIRSIRS